MTLDDVPRSSRRRRSRKKRGARKRRRYTKVIGWSMVGLVMTTIFVIAAIYIILSLRGEGSGLPQNNPVPEWAK